MLIAALAAVSILLPGRTTEIIQGFSKWFLQNFDGLTLGIATGSLVICIIAAVGPWGRLRLGGSEARPEFSTVSWLAMLFAAGMGAGLVVWGAAEPLIFTVSPPPGAATPETAQAIADAYALTMFHWAFHAWAIYGISALAIGYMAYANNTAPLPSVPFQALPSPMRRLIDWASLFAVTFGIVASLGQGAINMGAGVDRIFGDGSDGIGTQVLLLLCLLSIYMVSTWNGLKGGIEPLSNFNMGLAACLMVFVLIAGPTVQLFGDMTAMGTAYLSQFVQLSIELRPEGEARDWTRAWSLTYFLWWIAWTPFVGVFIARISRGRTIREFLIGVVFIPSVLTLFWFAIFGGAAIDVQLTDNVDLGISDFATAPSATYVLMEQFPLTLLTQIATFLLMFTFLVTSADSGSYVMAVFSSRRSEKPPKGERIFWGLILAALTIGAIASAEGQNATRALAVVGAIPLAFLIVAQTFFTGQRIWQDWQAER
ncbi:MAG: BCCT family transporter [Aquisalinus sp.]|nr:BCCT family transporter [Aquisalinus sp.]